MSEAPSGKQWLLGLGLLFLLLALFSIDLMFLFYLLGRNSVTTLALFMATAVVFLLTGLILVRAGSRPIIQHAPADPKITPTA